MNIVILVEGETEEALLPVLRKFINDRLAHGTKRPRLQINCYDGRVPTGDRLRKIVERELSLEADAVIALTDVYTGSPEFQNAADAKQKMLEWTRHNKHFYPHTALHDFEAWLLPYWDEIKKLSGTSRSAPAISPEGVNHNKPPAQLLAEVFRSGTRRKSYSKVRDAARILKGKDLTIAANACPELKHFLNRILGLCGGQLIP